MFLLAGTRTQQFMIAIIVPEYPHHADRNFPKDGYDKRCDIVPGMKNEIRIFGNECVNCTPGQG